MIFVGENNVFLRFRNSYLGLAEPYLGLAEPFLGLAEPFLDLAEPYPGVAGLSPAQKIKKNPGQRKRQFYAYFYVKKLKCSSPLLDFWTLRIRILRVQKGVRPSQVGFGPSRWVRPSPD